MKQLNFQWISSKDIFGSIVLCFLLCALSSSEIRAQTNAKVKEISALRMAIERNSNDLKLHKAFISAYINAFGAKDSLLIAQYQVWTKRFSKNADIPFAIGKFLAEKEDPRAKNFLLTAIRIKPDEAESWMLLSSDAFREGNKTAANTYLQKAASLDRKNADYAFYYANSFDGIDSSTRDSLLLDVAWRFPQSERSAQALYWLARNSTNQAVKLAYYQQLYEKHSEQASQWTDTGIHNYCDLLLRTNYQKAFEVALAMMVKTRLNHHYWAEKFNAINSFVRAKDLAKANRLQEASELVSHRLKYRISITIDEMFALFRAELADAAGQTRAAYDSLLVYYSKYPSDTLRSAAANYAGKLGLETKQIDRDIWKILDHGAPIATDFSLEKYMDTGRVALSDYRGKVVLLTYWFPGCGPCRAEFPFFESVMKKFNDKQVAYVGINIYKDQDSYVVPFMRSTGYSFIPLRDNQSWNKGNIPVNGAPENYLIDQRGRIIYSGFRIDDTNTRMLELMISEIINNDVNIN